MAKSDDKLALLGVKACVFDTYGTLFDFDSATGIVGVLSDFQRTQIGRYNP